MANITGIVKWFNEEKGFAFRVVTRSFTFQK